MRNTILRAAHLEIKGEILKVRVLALNPNASLVIADFRATNPSDVLFVVSTVGMRLDPLSGQPVEGVSISKPDVDNVLFIVDVDGATADLAEKR